MNDIEERQRQESREFDDWLRTEFKHTSNLLYDRWGYLLSQEELDRKGEECRNVSRPGVSRDIYQCMETERVIMSDVKNVIQPEGLKIENLTRQVMEIIKLEKPPTFPWRGPSVPPETEEEAQVWAKGMGADTLYVYERHGQVLYLVEGKG